MTDEPHRIVEDELEDVTVCPFCEGGRFATRPDEDGGRSVLHSMPMCEAFTKKDANQYLSEAKEMAARALDKEFN